MRITRIDEQRRDANRRSIFVDGAFAFGCKVVTVARYRLVEGMEVTESQLADIRNGAVRQEAFDAALRLISRRPQSEAEVRRKLARYEFGAAVLDAACADLVRLGYLDDAKMAANVATSSAKREGPQRTRQRLAKAGIKRDVSAPAVAAAQAQVDSAAVATALAKKRAASLRRLDPPTANRRLYGFLARRGFGPEAIKAAIARTLGRDVEVDE